MGCLFSCLDRIKGGGGAAATTTTTSETEMKVASAGGSGNDKFVVSRAMSSPTVSVERKTTVSGFGLALAAVTIEQDSAYWEAHVDGIDENQEIELYFGVATKKDRSYYKSVEEGGT